MRKCPRDIEQEPPERYTCDRSKAHEAERRNERKRRPCNLPLPRAYTPPLPCCQTLGGLNPGVELRAHARRKFPGRKIQGAKRGRARPPTGRGRGTRTQSRGHGTRTRPAAAVLPPSRKSGPEKNAQFGRVLDNSRILPRARCRRAQDHRRGSSPGRADGPRRAAAAAGRFRTSPAGIRAG